MLLSLDFTLQVIKAAVGFKWRRGRTRDLLWKEHIQGGGGLESENQAGSSALRVQGDESRVPVARLRP